MKKVWFTLETANQIVGYLGTKPYTEVPQLIAGIQQEAQAQAQPEKVDAEPVN